MRVRFHSGRFVATGEPVDLVTDEVAELQGSEHPQDSIHERERHHGNTAATELGEAEAVVLEPSVVDEAKAHADRRTALALEEGDEVASDEDLLPVEDESPGARAAVGKVGEALEAREKLFGRFGFFWVGTHGCSLSVLVDAKITQDFRSASKVISPSSTLPRKILRTVWSAKG